MKQFVLAAALAVIAMPGFAQIELPKVPPVDPPKHKCEDPGEYPGRVGMLNDERRKRFERQLEAYKQCMLTFIETSKANMKAQETAVRATIDEYNGKMKKYSEEQANAQ